MGIFTRKRKKDKNKDAVSGKTKSKNQYAKLSREELDALIKQEIEKLGDDSGETKEAAFRTLVEIGADAVEPLISTLKSETLRESAAKALGEIRDKRAIEPLVEVMHSEGWDRFAAALALTKLGDERGLGFFDVCIHPDPMVDNFLFRRFAALYLGELKKGCEGNSRAIEILMKAYETEEEPAVRRDIVQSLGNIGNISVKNTLNKALNDQDDEVQQAAKEALAKL